MVRGSAFVLGVAVTLFSPCAHATYSVIGVDKTRRDVGAVAASCLGGSDVSIIYGSVPARGVVVAQASFHEPGRQLALELLAQGVAPRSIIRALTDTAFDPRATSRQYAVADVDGIVAAFTGEDTGGFAADHQGASGGFAYSVQGNILTSDRVLSQAALAFEAGGCDLAERLLAALEAGAEGGEGDSRCTERGIVSDSAFLQVDRAGEASGSYLLLRVPTSGDESPLPELRAQFTEWRKAHPCPSPLPVGHGGAGSSGADAPGAEDPTAESASCGFARVRPKGTGSDAALLIAAVLVSRRRGWAAR